MKGDDNTYVVSMKLPDYRKEDVHVELRDEFVAVRAVRRTHPERGRSAQRLEAISRSFRLPADADREHLEATFDDGTLTLRIHRLEFRSPRSVELS
jgi:HSP20 family molecular chaperone IbpA